MSFLLFAGWWFGEDQLRLSAVRESMSEATQALCFLAGANSIFTGDKLLTAPNAGDDKYGDFARNKDLMKQGLKRMFLHAHSIEFKHPLTGEPLHIDAPLAPELQQFIDRQDKSV
jgi:hypothetical protein